MIDVIALSLINKLNGDTSQNASDIDTIETKLDNMEVPVGENTDAGLLGGVYAYMQANNLHTFVGFMRAKNYSRYFAGYAVFNGDYSEGCLMRIAFASNKVIKYRLRNNAWNVDEYVADTTTSITPVAPT